MTKHAGCELLDNLVSLITKPLKKGASESELRGSAYCRLENVARLGRNPATGEAIKIKPSKKVAFRASKELKEAI